jgi:osmotically-inducible protein OsmY
MKTDSQLQQDVLEELKWEPSLTPGEIGVSVNNGAVTLSGIVPTYAEKQAAERAARRVEGVKAVAEEVQVKPTGPHELTDAELAEAVAQALRWNVWVPSGVQATVEKGWVTLQGTVKWEFQRNAALNAVRYLPAVKGVSNFIGIKPSVQPNAVKFAIEKALERNAQIHSEDIRVAVDGGKVTLSGVVESWAEHDVAGEAAWNAPGVTTVENEIKVTY